MADNLKKQSLETTDQRPPGEESSVPIHKEHKPLVKEPVGYVSDITQQQQILQEARRDTTPSPDTTLSPAKESTTRKEEVKGDKEKGKGAKKIDLGEGKKGEEKFMTGQEKSSDQDKKKKKR